jgi:hypothetical protein
MTNEERQRTMDFIIAQQAQFRADMQELKESQLRADLRANERTEREDARMQREEARMERTNARMDRVDALMDRGNLRLDRLERILKLTIKAGRRVRRELREEDERFGRRLAEIAELISGLGRTQAHHDQRLAALADTVDHQRNDSA